MNILISPNAFKNSLDAKSVAFSIKEGLIRSGLKCNCECFPIADGGDGTGNLIIEKLNGVLIESKVKNPLGEKIKTSFGLIENGETAIIEMANASGLDLLKKGELNPLKTNSFGTGEQIAMALDKGVKRIIIGMGGSATVDGGCGILRALGIRFLNKTGKELIDLPNELIDLSSIDTSRLDKRILEIEVIVLCDVKNKLLGENGAAMVFGPQKGATKSDSERLDKCLSRLSKVIHKHFNKDISKIESGGTAGGAAAGLYGLINAKLVNGIEYFLDLTGFDEVLKNIDLVITGEGSIDGQTIQGKGPYGVAIRAKSLNIPVIGIAGKVPYLINDELHQYFDILLPINNEPVGLPVAMKNASLNIERTAFSIGKLLSISHSLETGA